MLSPQQALQTDPILDFRTGLTSMHPSTLPVLLSYATTDSSPPIDTIDELEDDELSPLPSPIGTDPRTTTGPLPPLVGAGRAPSDYHPSAPSSSGSSSSSLTNARKRFKAPRRSHVLNREVGNPKPWMNGRKTITRDKKSYAVCLFGILAGLAGGAYLVADAFNVERDNWCPVLSDDFDGDTLNTSNWHIEQRIGGGESNDFTWFTDHNSYVADGNLFLIPSYTNETMLSTDYAVVNSTFIQLGSSCDSIHQTDCQIALDPEKTNSTLFLPPIQSAMISTRNKVSIKYGRVVIRAKMPKGDWLWPQISMVPRDEVYGKFPASGLISLFESRGNMPKSRLDILANDMVSGLHWGPADHPSYDRFWMTQGFYKVYRHFFNQEYYEFGMDWTDKSITMWVRSRVRISFRYGFGSKQFWKLGSFGYSYATGEIIANPWAGAENPHVAPFDQDFYLRIGLLAGGTDGYWLDSLDNKPWRNSDDRQQAMSRFWSWIGVWSPTWPSGDKIRDRGMAIDSVKMYQKC
ncbi:uncharacterized protein JCM15063_004134 [Sporobolomyces koalae]|uniref:uncharacterized protein n=1 Tax=Sporobolomyces koalae TaxID=500713 RepID=UPI003170D364